MQDDSLQIAAADGGPSTVYEGMPLADLLAQADLWTAAEIRAYPVRALHVMRALQHALQQVKQP